MTLFLIFLVTLCAVFTQSLTGFGLALVSMPILVGMVGLQVAAPLVALIGLVAETILLIRYRIEVSRTILTRLLLPSLIGIPIGVLALRQVGEAILLPFLGGLILVYSLYALWDPSLPSPQGAGWAYGAGFLGGLLGGAYNTSGPPVIVYGDSQKWQRGEFKGNLQGFFLFNSLFIVIGHGVARNITPEVWVDFLGALPAVMLGIAAGLWLDRRLDAVLFRKFVLVLLALLGIRFVLGV
jgi:uncharacterized protein